MVSSDPLKLGMVGGGQGAFIGAVHRMAAALDGQWVLVAGALSSTTEKSRASARELGLAADRSYATWREMLEVESARPAGERVDTVAIVTPNATHFEIAMAFVAAGFNIICDKPMVTTVAEAEALSALVKRMGTVFAVMYNYTGYPMVKQAAAMVRGGELGRVRKVFVEYHQGWLSGAIEQDGQKQASWRQNPAMAGQGGCIGDIGTHAENLLHTVTGLEIESLSAELTSFVPGRILDDDATVLLRMHGGAKGVLTASQVCIGEQNNLTLRVHGEHGSLWWRQEEPNTMVVDRADGTRQVYSRGGALAAGAVAGTRLPMGHPEGFLEAFANVYRGVAEKLRSNRVETMATGGTLAAGVPTVEDGLRGVRFVMKVVESSKNDGRWVKF